MKFDKFMSTYFTILLLYFKLLLNINDWHQFLLFYTQKNILYQNMKLSDDKKEEIMI